MIRIWTSSQMRMIRNNPAMGHRRIRTAPGRPSTGDRSIYSARRNVALKTLLPVIQTGAGSAVTNVAVGVAVERSKLEFR
jgi:hypothetical protein